VKIEKGEGSSSINWLEVVTYITAAFFIIGIFYFAFYYQAQTEKAKLEKGEIVEDEKIIKQEILKDVHDVQDELQDIGELVQ